MTEREKMVLSCAGHLSPEGICKVFGWEMDRLMKFCHRHKVAFDVNQVHKCSERYRRILKMYLSESKTTQGF